MSRRNRIQLGEAGVPQIEAMAYPEFTTTAEFVRRILPSIDKLASRGYQLSEIRDIVQKESGIDLPIVTFKSTVSRLRRNRKVRVAQRAPIPVPTPGVSVVTATPGVGISDSFRTHVQAETATPAATAQSHRGFVERDDL